MHAFAAVSYSNIWKIAYANVSVVDTYAFKDFFRINAGCGFYFNKNGRICGLIRICDRFFFSKLIIHANVQIFLWKHDHLNQLWQNTLNDTNIDIVYSICNQFFLWRWSEILLFEDLMEVENAGEQAFWCVPNWDSPNIFRYQQFYAWQLLGWKKNGFLAWK